MKPVIKTARTYSVLLMRDDSTASSFRMRAGWIKLFFFLLFLLLAAAGLGGYGSWYFHQKYHHLSAEASGLESELRQARLDLQSLGNIKTLQEKTGESPPAAPEPLNSESTLSSPAALPASRNASPPPRNATAPTSEQLAAVLGQQNATQGAAKTDQPTDFPFKIGNVSIRYSGNTRLRVSFDLSKQDNPQTIGGSIILHMVGPNADIPVTTANRDDLRFRISSFKKITTSFTLPPGLSQADIDRLRVEIDAEGLSEYSETFPISK